MKALRILLRKDLKYQMMQLKVQLGKQKISLDS